MNIGSLGLRTSIIQSMCVPAEECTTGLSFKLVQSRFAELCHAPGWCLRLSIYSGVRSRMSQAVARDVHLGHVLLFQTRNPVTILLFNGI